MNDRYDFDDRPLEPASAALERDAMAWPPCDWERPPSAWRDDALAETDAFLPYEAVLGGAPAVEADRRAPFPATGQAAREIIETILLTVLIFFGIRLVVQNFRIEGRSMEPTLHSGQYLLVNKLTYQLSGEPQRGDIIVFEAWGQDKDFIKRVIGLPGEEIEIRDGHVKINGDVLEEPYLDQSTSDSIGPLTIPQDQFYVMGDNRHNSSDSRAYEPLEADKIIGRAWLTYWPPGEIGLIPSSLKSYASD